MYTIQITICFLWELDQSWSHFFILLLPKKFLYYPLTSLKQKNKYLNSPQGKILSLIKEPKFCNTVLTIQDNLSLLFYLSINGNMKRLEYYDEFFVLFTVLMWSDSIFNLLKRVTGDSFLFLHNTLGFFLSFLNLGTQIRCPQNWYTDLKVALDQPLYVETNIWNMLKEQH